MTLAWIIAALFWSQRIAGRDWMRADWSFFCLCVSVQIACFLCSWRSSVECNCRLAQLTWIMARMGQEEGKALHAAERNPCCRTEARGLSFGGGGRECVCVWLSTFQRQSCAFARRTALRAARCYAIVVMMIAMAIESRKKTRQGKASRVESSRVESSRVESSRAEPVECVVPLQLQDA